MRLQFSTTQLYGRDQELAELQRIYDLVAEEGTSRLVLLDGYSGNGKTSLVSHFGRSILQTRHQQQQNDSSPRSDLLQLEDSTASFALPQSTTTRFIKGKFDEHNRKPYAAFVGAFRDLIASLKRHCHEECDRIAAIQKAVNDHKQSSVLFDIIPNLKDLMEEEDDDAAKKTASEGSHFFRRSSIEKNNNNNTISATTKQSTGSSRMLQRIHELHFQFKAFVRAACAGGPVILFCDDLQWADQSSLELLKALASDGSSRNLLIIGAYRGHEIEQNENHPLSWCINHLKNEEYLPAERLYELELSDFPLGDLNLFVADSLELAPEKTMSLSQVVWSKTHGNVFYSKQFLQELVDKELITFDFAYFRWKWETELIAGATDLSENVVEMVAARIRQLPPSVIQILKIASCLWYSFDVTVLEYIVVHSEERIKERRRSLKRLATATPFLSEQGVQVKDQSKVMQGLQAAKEQGLLDQTGANGYKFGHDRIREAVYSIIEEGEERDALHIVIGELLWYMFHDSTKSQQWMLFSAVDQLNKVSHRFQKSDAGQGLELAKVNLEAAECAMGVSAFLPAIDYLKSGLQFLGDNPWEDVANYRFCLTMHSKLAALEASVGHTEESEKLIQGTLQHAECFEDKLPLYVTKVESLGVQGKLKEALTLAYEVLEGLGEAFPQNTTGKRFQRAVQSDTSLTQKLLSKHNDATILALPLLQDSRKQYALKIMNLLVDSAFHLGEMMQLFLIINRMIRISLEYGLGDVSGVAFALYGFSLNSPNGDRMENYRYGKLALLLQERLAAKEWECRVLVFVYVLLNHWVEPLQKSLNPLLAAHSAGMQHGDIDYAVQASGAFLTLYWYSGNDLNFGVDEMRRFSAQMKDYKQEKALAIYLPLFQCLLNMTGPASDAALLCGEAISQAEYEEKKFTNSTIMSYQMQLSYYFNDMERAEELSTSLQKVSKSFNAHYLFVARQFFFGLISLRVAMDSKGKKRRRNIAVANRVIKEMEQWTQRGGINCLQKLLILNAEQKALNFLRQGRFCSKKEAVESVREAFDISIATAIRSGFPNDAALACERAAAFLDRCNQDAYWVQSYASRAVEYYKLWGANAKVDQLTAIYSRGLSTDLSSTPVHAPFRRSSVTYDHEKVLCAEVQVRQKDSSEKSSVRISNQFSSEVVLKAARGLLKGSGSLRDGSESVTYRDETTARSMDELGSGWLEPFQQSKLDERKS
ncbi:Protein tyrosine kinase [Seminavis robusta]|uniref:Protein tyrosine kinase n=1 Tax=Seminavis robusta TaxID=568900 RepID=A0A9N8DZQ6_9STRA|nr:Protein tyrosine kinase [Seminavis robusta]|eukprot:Sro504_g155960.1 Protein tyrosine kinase (1216) ;mRNA; f:25323-29146